MTRINVGIKPEELPNKLLLAEHREITRIPNAVRSGLAKIQNIPPTFRLGTGHVKFFYDKLLYIQNRYHKLYTECKSRGFNITCKSDSFNGISKLLMNNYQETAEDRKILIDRIESKGFSLKEIPNEDN
jgi:hypothetical protein